MGELRVKTAGCCAYPVVAYITPVINHIDRLSSEADLSGYMWADPNTLYGSLGACITFSL